MPSVNPYLGFDGNCEEAFQHYQSIFGGELQVSRFSEGPEEVAAPEDADKIMHVSLPIGEGQALMGSDRPSGMGSTDFGNSVSISVTSNSSDQARRIFESLAEGGEVTMPYERQFWGDDFGMCTDKFGHHWMVDYTPEPG